MSGMTGSPGNVSAKKAIKLPLSSHRRRSTGTIEGLGVPLLVGGAAGGPKVRMMSSEGLMHGLKRRMSEAFERLTSGPLDGAKTIGSMVWSQEMLNDLMESKSKAKLEEFGGVAAVAKGLGSSLKMGLTGADEPARRVRYGANKIDRRSPPSYWELFLEAMQDSTVLILLAAAFVSITLGIVVCAADLGQACPRKPIWQGPIDLGGETQGEAKCLDWLDGAAIIFACLLIGNITAYNESAKEKQFRVLQDKQQDCAVTVKRNGIEMRVQSVDVMVGDIVILDLGAKVPADGIFIKGSELRVDESSLTGEADAVNKDDADPFLFSGCMVVEGDCTFVVTAVGPHSAWGRIMMELDDDRDETPLQGKLTTLAEDIGKLGMLVAAVCFLAQLTVWFVINAKKTCFVAEMVDDVLVPTSVEDCKLGYPGLDNEAKCINNDKPRVWMTHYENFSFSKLQDLVGFFIDSVTIIVVAVPEGLPLAVTIALAYSVKKMQNDQNLVRVMAACETMGGATSICSDKTGTLTENTMTVVDGFLAGRAFDGNVPAGSRIGEPVMNILVDSVALNSKANLGADAKTGRPEIIGNRTEGALLMLLRLYRKDFNAVREAGHIIKQYPFSSMQKKMCTFVQLPGCARLYCKGASEILVSQCSKFLTEAGAEEPLTEELKKRVLQYISKMATKSLRTMALTMRDFASADELAPTDDVPEEGYTLVGVMGIQDPLRKEVPAAVKSCQAAGITVRMVTGDNLLTAKAIAKEAGIYTDGRAIEGPEFRAMSESEQRAVCSRLQVMARCSPHDKLTLVKRLKEMGEVVAVTGDGTNDAPALKEADVGLSMGIAGTAVAQEASDMVILDDNFSSIVKAVMWGRSVYDNIRKFLQFQLTVNVVALLVCTFGAALGFGTPLKPVQLLWVNLIMDTFGALALATEGPTADLLERKPYGRTEALVNGHMWRNILVQSVYQLAIMIYLLLQGAAILNDCTDGSVPGGDTTCTALKPNGQGKNELGNYRDTVIYNAFVWSQIFNEINARKIYNDKNVFSGIFNNGIYGGVIVLSCVVQALSVQYGGQVFKTVPIDLDDWLLCLGIGSISLVLGVFMRFLPPAEFVVRLISGPAKEQEEGEAAGAGARAQATQSLNEQL